MTDEKHNTGITQKLWTSHGAQLLGTSESAVLMLIGVALVLVIVVGLLVGSGPVRALESMRAHAQRIGRGELDARVELPKLYELRTLAESLNQMAVELVDLEREMRARERLNTFAGVAAGLAATVSILSLYRGRSENPMRNSSTARAACRPSRIAQTTSD